MATTKSVDPTKAIEALKLSLQGMVDIGLMTEEQMAKQISQAETGMKAPARSTVMEKVEKAVKDALKGKEIEQAFKILQKGAFKITVLIKEGEIDTFKVTASNTKSSSGLGGKRPPIMVDGKEYSSYASLCDAYSLTVGGDSAKRVWERMHKNNPDTYPAADEVL